MIVRGIVHCHSALSFDSQVSLTELCHALSCDDYQFVAMTEHTKGVSVDAYGVYVQECRRHTTKSFVVIPGLEVRCAEGDEIAAIGVEKFISDGLACQVVSEVRKLNGYAVWVHPHKRRPDHGRLLDCDAVEVLNGKTDGYVAPSLSMLSKLKLYAAIGRIPHAIFGLDLHTLESPRITWIECCVPELNEQEIVSSLKAGRFMNRTARVRLSSSATMSFREYLCCGCLRGAYVLWNAILEIAPRRLRAFLIWASRRLVAWAKLV